MGLSDARLREYLTAGFVGGAALCLGLKLWRLLLGGEGSRAGVVCPGGEGGIEEAFTQARGDGLRQFLTTGSDSDADADADGEAALWPDPRDSGAEGGRADGDAAAPLTVGLLADAGELRPGELMGNDATAAGSAVACCRRAPAAAWLPLLSRTSCPAVPPPLLRCGTLPPTPPSAALSSTFAALRSSAAGEAATTGGLARLRDCAGGSELGELCRFIGGAPSAAEFSSALLQLPSTWGPAPAASASEAIVALCCRGVSELAALAAARRLTVASIVCVLEVACCCGGTESFAAAPCMKESLSAGSMSLQEDCPAAGPTSPPPGAGAPPTSSCLSSNAVETPAGVPAGESAAPLWDGAARAACACPAAAAAATAASCARDVLCFLPVLAVLVTLSRRDSALSWM